jgi:hypothetical protein
MQDVVSKEVPLIYVFGEAGAVDKLLEPRFVSFRNIQKDFSVSKIYRPISAVSYNRFCEMSGIDESIPSIISGRSWIA